MANFKSTNNSNFQISVLPTFGSPRKHTPIWDEGQKMFIVNQYESEAGHRYIEGIRFCENIVVKEKVGLWNSWIYINSLEVYAFNGKKLDLIQKSDYPKQFRDEAFVRSETVRMVGNYITGCAKATGMKISETEVDEMATRVVNGAYHSFLADDSDKNLLGIIRLLEGPK